MGINRTQQYKKVQVPFAYIYAGPNGTEIKVEILKLNGATPPPGWLHVEYLDAYLPAPEVPLKSPWLEHDLKKFSSMKYAFINELLFAGLQYKFCGHVSAVMNELLCNTPFQVTTDLLLANSDERLTQVAERFFDLLGQADAHPSGATSAWSALSDADRAGFTRAVQLFLHSRQPTPPQ